MRNPLDQLQAWRLEQAHPQRGLPAFAYTDADFWATECNTVLSRRWVFVGFVHEFTNEGDAMPIDVGGKPVLLLRNRSGGIVAFHNVCRHRCLKLVDVPKNVGPIIRCPYHSWVYNLDGSLRKSPFFGGIDNHTPSGFTPAEHGLVALRCAIWHDWIFVNLDGNAPDFESYIAPLVKRLAGIDFGMVQPVATLDFGEVATNWKFLMENFIEPYHVQFVHQSTTDQPLKDHSTIVDGVCLGSFVDLPEGVDGGSSLAVSSRYLTLFPNFVIGRYFPNQLGVYLNEPRSPGRTAQRRVIYKTDGQLPDEAETAHLKKLWWDVHKEDHVICERLQSGRASPVAQCGGLLSPHWEDSVRAFQELVAAEVTLEN